MILNIMRLEFVCTLDVLNVVKRWIWLSYRIVSPHFHGYMIYIYIHVVFSSRPGVLFSTL